MTVDQDNKAFCVLPWIHRVFDTNGQTRICCNYPENHGSIENWQESWNDDYIRSLRKRMVEGDHIPECRICHFKENAGKQSDRQRYYHKFMYRDDMADRINNSIQNDYRVEEQPYFIEFRFGSLCNLKCKMCSGHYSSTVRKDSADLKKLDPAGYEQFIPFEDQFIEVPEDWFTKPECIAQMDKLIPYITEMHFAGGEPTMIPEYLELLKRCVELDCAKNMVAAVCTNLTNVSDELVDLIQQFGKTHITFSLDGSGSSYEYIRVPANWKKIRQNMIKLISLPTGGKMAVAINMVVQMCNILDLPETLDEFFAIFHEHKDPELRNFYVKLTCIMWPTRFRVDKMPLHIRELALERFRKWRATADMSLIEPYLEEQALDMLEQQLTAVIKPHPNLELLEYFEFIDQNKKATLQKKIPELHQMLVDGHAEEMLYSAPNFNLEPNRFISVGLLNILELPKIMTVISRYESNPMELVYNHVPFSQRISYIPEAVRSLAVKRLQRWVKEATPEQFKVFSKSAVQWLIAYLQYPPWESSDTLTLVDKRKHPDLYRLLNPE